MALQKTSIQFDYHQNDQSLCIVEAPSNSLALQAIILRHKAFCLAQPSTASDFATLARPASFAPDMYWLAYLEGQVAGCIGFRSLGAACGEIKSLHVLEASRRHGVADALLQQLIDYARCWKCSEVSLETGATDGFAPARRLYRRAGFVERGSFPPYLDHPRSCFMTLKL